MSNRSYDNEMQRRDIKRMRAGLEIEETSDTLDQSGALSYLPEGGYHIVSPEASSLERGGMSAHRGVLDDGEHVDHELLIDMLETELGYSFDEARLAFDPLAFAEEVPNYYAIRDKMVEIHEAGGNISLLADVLGIKRGTLATAIWRQKQRRKHDSPN